MMDFKALKKIIEENESFALFGHMNPDGDCVGAALGMAEILRNHFGKKDVRIFSHGGVPDFFRFLPRADSISGDIGQARAKVGLVILLDCGSPRRVGEQLAESVEKAERVAVVDHHVTNNGFGEVNVTYPEASSTCEIIYRFARDLGAEISPELATMLYTGVMYDTGRFIHSNTTPEVFEICSDLVAVGANPAGIAGNVYSMRSESHLRLMGYVLSNFQTAEDGRIAYCAISRKKFEEIGAAEEDNEGIVEQMGGYDRCEVHATFMELPGGLVRVSMRSKGRVVVGEICRKLGGGGHDMAAGIRIKKSLEEVVEIVMSETRTALRALEDGEAAV